MHSASFITCFSVEALHSSEIHRVRSSALSLLSPCRVDRSPRWSRCERCRVCGAPAIFPKIESHRAKRVSSAPTRAGPTKPPLRAIKNIHEISGRESGLRFRQTVARGELWGLISGDVEPVVSPPSSVSLPVSLSTRHLRSWYYVNSPRDPFNGRISRWSRRAYRNNV